jgi:hypothetical protein
MLPPGKSDKNRHREGQDHEKAKSGRRVESTAERAQKADRRRSELASHFPSQIAEMGLSRAPTWAKNGGIPPFSLRIGMWHKQ